MELIHGDGGTDDGQELTALNEIYLGQPSHQTARYTCGCRHGQAEAQASSGLIVATGTGGRLVPVGVAGAAQLTRAAGPADRGRLAWFVREAWPSPTTGTVFTEGSLAGGEVLEVTAESDQLVLFGDGVESDTVPLTWGQTARLRISSRSLRLLH